jgi:hypothetical protein
LITEEEWTRQLLHRHYKQGRSKPNTTTLEMLRTYLWDQQRVQIGKEICEILGMPEAALLIVPPTSLRASVSDKTAKDENRTISGAVRESLR